jgi:hypothetical protein
MVERLQRPTERSYNSFTPARRTMGNDTPLTPGRAFDAADERFYQQHPDKRPPRHSPPANFDPNTRALTVDQQLELVRRIRRLHWPDPAAER